MFHFVYFCISNFTVFSVPEIILFLVFLQKVLFSLLIGVLHNYHWPSESNIWSQVWDLRVSEIWTLLKSPHTFVIFNVQTWDKILS